jgi:hypothetical protein
MKTTLVYLVVLATVCFAQFASAEQLMLVNVPFDFTANHTQMPAGRYVVSRITENTLALQSQTGKKSLFVLTFESQRDTANSTAELVFDRFGSRYFLSKVWTRNSSLGYELHVPKPESQQEHVKVALNAEPR